MEQPIDEQHEAQLKTALKLSESQPLPESVVELYWDVSRTAIRLGTRISPSELILVVMLANRATTPDPVSFLDEEEHIQAGDRVLAKFRKAWRWGRFVRMDQHERRVIVALDDDPGENERSFAPTGVRYPSREELKAIGEV
jgi:hypothetical protein